MSSLKIVELSAENTCNICNNAISKYSCPKCNILYCSLACYQSEGHLVCSENFYKDSVMEHVGATSDKNSKSNMMEILERFHAQNGSKDDDSKSSDYNEDDNDDEYSDAETLDSDDDESLRERMTGVCLDNPEDVWQHLSNDEKQKFEALIMSGEINKYIPIWTPWWEYSSDKKIVNLEELEAHKCKCPKILTNIKKFSELLSKPPADCIQFNMMNILAAYVFTARYFNGDHMDNPKETSTYIYNLSLNVRKNENFDCFNLAIQSVVMECSQPELLIKTDEENIGNMKSDVRRIITGPHATEGKFYLLCALSEIHAIFDKAVTQGNEAASNGEFYNKFTKHQVAPIAEVASKTLKKLLKKIEFFLSYAKDLYEV